MTTKEFIIKTNKENLFKYFNELDYQKQWIMGLEDIVHHDDKNFTMYLKEGKKVSAYSGTVLQSIGSDLLEIYVKNHAFATHTIYKLQSLDNNTTKLTYINTIELSSTAGKIIWAIIGKPFTYIIVKMMFSKLKKLAEQNN